jgi:hypothetical protein
MNKATFRHAAISVGLAVLLLLAVGSLMGATNPGGSGIIGQKYTGVSPMTFAGVHYTSTQTASATGVDVGLFGSVEIQTLATVTGTFVVTITPQFSDQPVVCSAVTSWVNAFDEQNIPTTSRTTTVATSLDGTVTVSLITTTNAITSVSYVTNTTTSTTVDTSGTLARQTLSLVTSGTVAAGANTIELRELPTQGRCFRVNVQSTATIFTPTVYLRLVNRQ